MKLSGLLYEKRGNVGVITLNNPEKMNILNISAIESLSRLITNLSLDYDIRSIVVTGAGRAFCAGADIGSESEAGPYEIVEFSKLGGALMHKIANFRAPVIGAINGYALGGGVELSLACDYRIASEKARFGSPEITLGTIAGWGGVQGLSKVIGMSKAKQLLFTGKTIKADEALKIGLVDEVASPDETLPKAMELAGQIAAMSPLAVELCKRAVMMGENFNVEEIGPLYITEDSKEAYAAWMEKRPNRGYLRK